jgi:oligosaccharide translocation protein RFT1
MSSQDALRESSLSSLTALVGLQLVSRLFTFVLNQALIRMTSPEIFGAAAIQFELILSTILFLSREGVRTTILRVKTPGPKEMNLSFLPLAIGAPLAGALAWIYVQNAQQSLRDRPLFNEAMAVYAVAAVLELLTEPFHNWCEGQIASAVMLIGGKVDGAVENKREGTGGRLWDNSEEHSHLFGFTGRQGRQIGLACFCSWATRI